MNLFRVSSLPRLPRGAMALPGHAPAQRQGAPEVVRAAAFSARLISCLAIRCWP